MDAFYSIKHKGKIAVLLVLIIALVLYSSKIYNDSISKLGSSLHEVYADRLIAHDYIHKMAQEIYLQKIHLREKNFLKKKDVFVNSNSAIEKIMLQYEKTKLTKDEKNTFEDLRKNVFVLKHLLHLETNQFKFADAFSISYEKQIDNSLHHLDKLASIQISRGKDLNTDSKKIISFSNMMNQFDWAMLLLIGIIIQAIIFSSKSTQPLLERNQSLN